MQDFFCPKCGRRMLDGRCAHCDNASARRGTSARSGESAHTGDRRSAGTKTASGSALTEEKIIPFESINGPSQPEAGKKAANKKEEVHITLVDAEKLRQAEARERLKKEPWKDPSLGLAKRAALFVSHLVSRFTAFVDGLVNPEEE